MRKMAEYVNQTVEGSDYAVLFDSEPHKSKRWAFETAKPFLKSLPKVGTYRLVEDTTIAKEVSVLVVFDDMIGSGMDISGCLAYVSAYLKQVQRILVAVPYIGPYGASRLRSSPDVIVLPRIKGKAIYNLLPSVGKVLSGEELGPHMSVCDPTNVLASFEMQSPPDTIAFPRMLRELFFDEGPALGIGELSQEISPAPYKIPGPYFDQEEKDFQEGHLNF
jgi:hypothetical protein